MIDLFIPGTPVQQGSLVARLIWSGGKPRAVLRPDTGRRVGDWKRHVARHVADLEHPEIGPYVAVSAVFHMPKPRTTKYPDYPAGTPDLDKLQRAIGDALTESGIVADDARIVRWHVDEVWAGGLGSTSVTPGVALRVTER